MVITMKMPVSEVVKNNVMTKIETFMYQHKDSAYTMYGIMSEVYGINKSELAKTYHVWGKENRNLYQNISHTLKKLVKEQKLKTKKVGRSYFFWVAQ